MNAIQSLLNFLKKKKETDTNETPEGFCPNCWGRQEFAGKFYESAKNNNFDINSKNPDIGWVQDYANKHLSGILLKKEDDKLVCQKCKLSYSPN
jgi:hypothetical protein